MKRLLSSLRICSVFTRRNPSKSMNIMECHKGIFGTLRWCNMIATAEWLLQGAWERYRKRYSSSILKWNRLFPQNLDETWGAGWEFGCHVFHPDVQSTLCAWPDTEYTRWHLETTNEAYCKTLPAAPFWMYWTYSFSEWQTWLHSSKSCFGFIFSMTWHDTFYDWYHPFCCSFSCCLLFVVVAVFVVVVLCVLFVVVVKSMSIKCQ